MFRVVSRRDTIDSEHFIILDDESVEICEGSLLLDTISHEQITEDAEEVLYELRKGCVDGTLDFDTGELEERYHLSGVSADSSSKTDITLEIIDPLSGRARSRSFSVKSFIGRRPTLMNSSQSTNIIYRIEGELSDSDIKDINSMLTSKGDVDVTGRVRSIYDKGCRLA